MTFYVSRNADGLVHVTNTIGGLIGQHHVHTEEGFAEWRRPDDEIIELQETEDCTCALAAGEAQSKGSQPIKLVKG